MPRLSRAQQEARRQIEGLAGSRLYPQQLASKLLKALLKAVPSDGGGLVGLDPATLLHNRLLAAVPGSLSLVSGFYRNVYLSDPVPALLPPALMRARLPVVVLHRRLERSLGLPQSLLRVALRWRTTAPSTPYSRSPAGACARRSRRMGGGSLS